MAEIRINIGGQENVSQSIGVVNKRLEEMALASIKSAAASELLGKKTERMAAVMANLAKAITTMGGHLKDFGGIKEKELDFRKQSRQATEYALSMINLRDAGSAFVIMGQQLRQSVQGMERDFLLWNERMQQTAVLATKLGEDVSTTMRDDISRQVEAMALRFSLSSTDMALALREIVAMGFDVNEALLILEAGAGAAVSGLGDINTVGPLVVTVLRAFGLETSEANSVAAILGFIANKTGLQINDMANAMQYAASQAGVMNFSVAETAATLGIMTDAGLESSVAGTALRQFLVRLADPTSEAREEMDRLGISYVDAEDNFLSLPEIMRNIINATSELSEAQQIQTITTLFEVRGQMALNLVRARGIDNLEDLTKAAGEFEDEQTAVNFLTDTSNKMLANQAALLRNSEERLRAAGRILAGEVIPIQTQFNNLQAAMLEGMKMFPQPIQAMAGGMIMWGSALLQSSGQLFLLITSIQTAEKSLRLTIGKLLEKTIATQAGATADVEGAAAETVHVGAMDRLGAAAHRLKLKLNEVVVVKHKMMLATMGIGFAMGGLFTAMGAIQAQSEAERLTLSALTGIMFAMAAATWIAAAARWSFKTIIGGAIVAGIAATATTAIIASMAAAERESQPKAQQGLFIPARPGRGTPVIAGEGANAEFFAPEPMLRAVVRDEMQRVVIEQRTTHDSLIVNIPPFGRPDPRDVRSWLDVFYDHKRRMLRG